VIYPTNSWKWCKCKNIGGVYLYGGKHLVCQKSKTTSKMIDVSNGVRYGLAKEGVVKVIEKRNDIYELPYDDYSSEKSREILNRIIMQKRSALKLIEKYGKKRRNTINETAE
jgi:hypothetical protein